MDWQFYWKRWHFGFDQIQDDEFGIIHNYLFIGPLQLKWYS
jgi:hypothetical protein